ncbi:MAG: winged helix-turn-helix domain-containing tetratricopeptide repeat protein [Alphaproteobacteria bacterium]|nr:winged helix-turn-helix domain-containing tetratricopeptide repeat protein [Alphaproteobacteria bacterium]
MAPESEAASYLIGNYELDLRLHELRRNGSVCAIEPQVFDLLRYLIENRDRLIDREELNEQLWQGRFVSDASVSTAIKQARQAIGDDGKTQAFIRTVPRRGFRFVGEVAVKGAGDPPDSDAGLSETKRQPPGKMPWIPAFAVALVMFVSTGLIIWHGAQSDGPEEKPSIAVLPFDNMSGDPAQGYFADGMTDDLITQLSKVDGLFVIARNSTFTYKGKHAKVQDIAKDLGVRYVLEGSVRRADGQVRINAQLTDGTTGGHVWAEIFSREAKDIFALQDDVIAKIVAALRVTLTAEEMKTLAKLPTKNLQAYDLYLKAQKAHRQYLWKPLQKALELYKQATDLDPGFVEAYAGEAAAADFVARYRLYQVHTQIAAHRRARQAVEKALAINPDHAGALSAKSSVLTTAGAHDEAILTARQAVTNSLNDASARTTLAEALVSAGRLEEGLQAIEAALKLNPKASNYDGYRAGWVYFMNRRYERALELHRSVIKRNPNYFQANNGLIVSYAALGRLEEAKNVVKTRIGGWTPLNVQAAALHRIQWVPEVLEFWLAAYRKAGMPDWPMGFKGDEANRLSGAEIKKLIMGHRIEGKAQSGWAYSFDVERDGSWTWQNQLFTLTGSGRVEGDLWCYQADTDLPNRRQCVPYYRNPAGSPDKKNEYVNPDVYFVLWFSVVD